MEEKRSQKGFYHLIFDRLSRLFLRIKVHSPTHQAITKNCFVKQLGPRNFRIILTQGLNRQIRRMCEALGYRVLSLKRVRIMNIKLDVQTGKYRELTKEELLELNRLLENSSKTYE